MNTLNNPKKFAHELCGWYRENRRALPFRETRDPYRILVSEIMLQQTQMDTVIPYYERFVAQFPDVFSLASASGDAVLKAWEGLGYYRRAKYLHAAAQSIVHDHQGLFPRDRDQLKALPGIGDYTAGAIASIAFDCPVPAIDGNVIRVMTRVLAERADMSKRIHIKQLEHVLQTLLPYEPPADFTQAMMELGALICQKKPKCSVCPIQSFCQAYQTNTPEQYPVFPAKPAKSLQSFIVFVLTHEQGHFVFETRPKEGLLGGLLQLPQYAEPLTEAIRQLEKSYAVHVKNTTKLWVLKHVFTHIVWTLHVYAADVTEPDTLVYQAHDNLIGTLSQAHRKIIDRLKK